MMVHKLALATHQGVQLLLGVGREWTGLWANRLAEVGEQIDIPRICFGQTPRRFRNVMRLARVDHRDGHLRQHQRGDDGAFPAARRFDHQEGRRLSGHPGDAGGDARLRIGKLGRRPSGAARDIQMHFRNIDAKKGL